MPLDANFIHKLVNIGEDLDLYRTPQCALLTTLLTAFSRPSRPGKRVLKLANSLQDLAARL